MISPIFSELSFLPSFLKQWGLNFQGKIINPLASKVTSMHLHTIAKSVSLITIGIFSCLLIYQFRRNQLHPLIAKLPFFHSFRRHFFSNPSLPVRQVVENKTVIRERPSLQLLSSIQKEQLIPALGQLFHLIAPIEQALESVCLSKRPVEQNLRDQISKMDSFDNHFEDYARVANQLYMVLSPYLLAFYDIYSQEGDQEEPTRKIVLHVEEYLNLIFSAISEKYFNEEDFFNGAQSALKMSAQSDVKNTLLFAHVNEQINQKNLEEALTLLKKTSACEQKEIVYLRIAEMYVSHYNYKMALSILNLMTMDHLKEDLVLRIANAYLQLQDPHEAYRIVKRLPKSQKVNTFLLVNF